MSVTQIVKLGSIAAQIKNGRLQTKKSEEKKIKKRWNRNKLRAAERKVAKSRMKWLIANQTYVESSFRCERHHQTVIDMLEWDVCLRYSPYGTAIHTAVSISIMLFLYRVRVEHTHTHRMHNRNMHIFVFLCVYTCDATQAGMVAIWRHKRP